MFHWRRISQITSVLRFRICTVLLYFSVTTWHYILISCQRLLTMLHSFMAGNSRLVTLVPCKHNPHSSVMGRPAQRPLWSCAAKWFDSLFKQPIFTLTFADYSRRRSPSSNTERLYLAVSHNAVMLWSNQSSDYTHRKPSFHLLSGCPFKSKLKLQLI